MVGDERMVDGTVNRKRWLVIACLLELVVLAGVGWAGWRAGRSSATAPSAASSAPPAANTANPVVSASEMAFFRERYGPDHFSEREEEWMIRDFFQDRRDGIFVDVGAHHFKSSSKTYYLESKLGWSGLAIEPQTEFAAEYAQYRPRTKFLPFFVSDVSNAKARLYVLDGMRSVASSNEAFVRQFGKPSEVREVPSITLTDLLDAENVKRIDFLSMDIELHEPKALKGFDIARFRPSLVCIEALTPVRQEILDYFARNGYVVVGKYVWVDLENLYFAPLDNR
jgi:FkbM family methyltransferase